MKNENLVAGDRSYDDVFFCWMIAFNKIGDYDICHGITKIKN